MKPAVLFPAVIIVSIAAGAIGARLFGPQANASERKWGVPEEPDSTSDLDQRLDAVIERLGVLELRQEQWVAAPRQEVEGPAAGELLADKSSDQNDPTKQAVPAALTPDGIAGGPEDWFAAMTSGNLDRGEIQKLWDQALAAGKVDDLIELFKDRAEADPTNPDAQNALGDAYIQKVQTLGSSPQAGAVALRADKAFTKALELDPNHLNARRSKAIALSFWPPVMGKQAECVQQFEVLIEKQNLVPVEPDHMQAYLLLGNMHMQMGKFDQARAVWENGLSRFPGNENLMRQLDLIDGR